MIELFVDILNNKILGYNSSIIDEKRKFPNRHIIDNPELEKYIIQNIASKGLFYSNGEIIEKDIDDSEDESELKALSDRKAQLQALVDNEHKILMDNILSGMTLEEASFISKNNRDTLKALDDKIVELENKIQDSRSAEMNSRFEQEESSIDYKYFLSMVTIVRDENDYLAEWIRYHIEEMGFDHFYIYDNESSVPVEKFLQSIDFKYLDKLTIIDWKTSNQSQEDSHNDFLENFRNETRWFIGMDPDEYITLKNSGQTLIDFLKAHLNCATIKCLWKHYNANGHETKTDEPDMVRFTQETDWEDWKHGGKKFAQSNRIGGFYSYVPVPKEYTINLDYENEEVQDFFQLNHYYTRSYEEWVQKIKRGSSNPNFRRKYSDFFELNPDMKHLDIGEDYEQGYGSAEHNHSDTQENGEI